MNIILTKYNVPNLSSDDPISMVCSLNNKGGILPNTVTLSYLIKALGLKNPKETNNKATVNRNFDF